MIAAPGAFFEVGLHVLAGMTVCYGLLRICRWIRGQSPLLGAIVVAGLLLQATSGLLMFWVSYLDLPALSGLHSGDGFWEIAPDAAFYTRRAAEAVEEGVTTIDPTEASPAYLRLLTIWMQFVGISPASGLFLNMTLYGLFCALVVRVSKPSADWRRDLPLAVLLASMSFSPLLVFSGTQTLKDNTYLFLLAAACVGTWLVLGVVTQGLRRGTRFSDVLVALGLLLLSLYAMAGIRAYYALMLWGTLSLMLALVAGPWSWEQLRSRFPLAVAIVILTLCSFLVGAGPYVDAWMTKLAAQAEDSEELDGWVVSSLRLIDRYRVGFETTPAATNIAARRPRDPRDEDVRLAPVGTMDTVPAAPATPTPPLAVEPPATPSATTLTPGVPIVPPAPVAPVMVAGTASQPAAVPSPPPPNNALPTPNPPAAPISPPASPAPVVAAIATPPPDAAASLEASPASLFARRMMVGLATFFVPMSLLKALSLVQFPGGRGLLFLTDVDTLFLDATMIASLVLLTLRWNTVRRHLPYVCCLLLLACVSTALLSYVVINFGTLVRLRPMAVVPIWMAVLAAAPGRDRTELPPESAAVRDVIP